MELGKEINMRKYAVAFYKLKGYLSIKDQSYISALYVYFLSFLFLQVVGVYKL
jgi:hypothetical protein